MIYFDKTKLVRNFRTYFVHYLLYLLLIFFFFCSESEAQMLMTKRTAVCSVAFLLLLKIFADGFILKKNRYDNSMLRELINNSPLMSYVLSPDGKFLFGNARAERFFRTGIDITLDGEHIDLALDGLSKDEKKETKHVIKSGECFKTEKPMLMTNGDYAWYLIHKIPLKDRKGKIYAVINFSKNIDTEKRIQDQRETYIATLSHDLKTPAIAQVRALELLLSGQMGEFNSAQKEILQLTLDSCNYMYDMVYTLLSTCKFENGSVVLNYSHIDMLKLVKECIKEMSNLAKDNFVCIHFNPKNKEYYIDGDRIELKRVIINLLSNAINYAFKKSVIRITVSFDNLDFSLRVINSSPYIEPEIMSGLFRKYVSHSEKYNKVGVGLGLYLSKKIIDAHHGQIIAHSSKSQSNTFGFIIPQKGITQSNVELCEKREFVTLK